MPDGAAFFLRIVENIFPVKGFLRCNISTDPALMVYGKNKI
jgi:hypothetical protein